MSTDLDRLTTEVVENLEDILAEFGIVDITKYEDRWAFPCPIHGSDNDESLNVFVNGHSSIGNWKCWSHECEQQIVTDKVKGEEVERPLGKNVFGLIRGLLANEHGRHFQYGEAIGWCKKYLEYDGSEDIQTNNDKDKLVFVKQQNVLLRERKHLEGTLNRAEIRASLTIPARYFIGRGFTPDILDRYDVGYCDTRGRQMYNRIVVPVYDDDYNLMVGCVGRTIQPKCDYCGKYHYDNLPCPTTRFEKYMANKWVNSKGFNAESTLYNYWFAKQHIEKTGCAILVEGQGDVWRLEESGFKIGLGLFGDSLTDDQKLTLDASGAMNLIIATDTDEAGMAARDRIQNKCKRSYNCYFVDLPGKDIGECSPDVVKQVLDPILTKLL